jgi:hypothetical protein
MFGQNKVVLFFAYQTETYQSINLRSELALIRRFQGRDDSAHCLSASFFKHHHDVAL